MGQTVAAVLFVLAIFLSILGCLEAGWRAGRRRLEADPEKGFAGLGAVEGAVFGLMGLLMAFTFSGAASRFDARREQIVQEANAVGTAYLRLDLVPASAQPPLRDLFRRYLDARIAYYRAGSTDPGGRAREEARWTALQGEIWSAAVAASGEASPPSARMLLLPALNEMFDVTTTRRAALRMHPSPAIFVMLGIAVLAGALFAGWGMAASSSRSVAHLAGFALLMTVAVYVILDLEYPRIGFLRIDSFDSLLAEVRASMN